ncbi:hypothetical protein [uncultured Tateyamaria sp.]|uniref:hypothetical protein n=1 Tax=uncultured Tateyamaria sp. TaxID=455651 RepID=UPI002633AAF6|nr:hypothetical protein [uncultured Tateyamaria sp.]
MGETTKKSDARIALEKRAEAVGIKPGNMRDDTLERKVAEAEASTVGGDGAAGAAAGGGGAVTSQPVIEAIALETIRHNGKRYKADMPMRLTRDEFRELERIKAVRLAG